MEQQSRQEERAARAVLEALEREKARDKEVDALLVSHGSHPSRVVTPGECVQVECNM